jgi:glucokinase
MNRRYVALDIGATNVRVASGDERGLGEKISERTDLDHGPDGISAQLIRMIRTFDIEDLAAVGVGSIGPIDLRTGSIVETPNLPFKSIPVQERLASEFHVPVRMLNDCTAAVLGEKEYGAGKGLRHLAYVTLSTGLGGGAIVDGHVLVGKDGNAVEVGHLTIDPGSPLVCGCGRRGHWEAHSSGKNIPNYARLLLNEIEAEGSLLLELAGGDPEGITTEVLFEAAQKRDPTALSIVYKIGEVNAIGFADIVNVFDPQLENIDRHLINRRPEIKITPLGEEIVLHGALALAVQIASPS